MKFFQPSKIHILSAIIILVALFFLPIVPQNSPLHNHGGSIANIYYQTSMKESINHNFIHPTNSYPSSTALGGNQAISIIAGLIMIMISYSAGFGINYYIQRTKTVSKS